MHPNGAFRSEATALAFVAEHGFAHLFAMTPAGARVAHAPLVVTAEQTLRFHLANANALTPHLDGARLLVSLGGPGSYVSANWYADRAANVPTWNYRTVEIEGLVTALDRDALAALLELSATIFEPRVGEDWTMAKLAPARAAAMMRAITGFELVPDAIRATDKASQNRSEPEARALMGAMAAIGDAAGAAAIRRTRGW